MTTKKNRKNGWSVLIIIVVYMFSW